MRLTTAAEFKALKPAGKPYEASDAKAPGLRLRVQPSGARVWWYVYKEPGSRAAPGKAHRIRLGDYPAMDLAAARKARERWAAQRSAAGAPDPHEVLAEQARETVAQEAERTAQAERDAWTVRRLGDAYLAALEASRRSAGTMAEIRRQFDRDVLPVIGDKPAAAVTSADVEAVLAPIADRGSLTLRNGTRVTLVSLYSWATGARRRKTLAGRPPLHLRGLPNPAAAVPTLDVVPRRERRAYTEAELRGLWRVLKSERGNTTDDALALILLTGCRASEAATTRWRDVDLDAATWTIPAEFTKSRRTHVVHLSRQAVELLEQREPLAYRGFVFGARNARTGRVHINTLRSRLATLLGRLDADTALTTHELRHTLLTAVVARFRYPQEVRRRVANHVSGDGLERVYVHASWDDEAREAWARWGGYLDGLVEGSAVVELRA